MIRDIVRDETFLSLKSETATKKDYQIAIDLVDTLRAHADECVGMAANMIGFNKNIIIVNVHDDYVVMYNPVIVAKEGEYETEEGCLSLDGVRKCTRYKKIEVEYSDINWKKKVKKFSGFTAQIVQHEVDHLNGVLI
ncbi:peptide deformylase [Succinivibrio dextrinosolvens]|uniref:peptide deformylase n=1 Tax=Succinivibrio dextrinosolvens TaxID=83771 RepID=UPI00241C7596|nr:peptide deformylase [Succinivibrio dextrinosolvens]MBE6424265.1 peptide deformylase [Succinivibrio dextrinosolvens]